VTRVVLSWRAMGISSLSVVNETGVALPAARAMERRSGPCVRVSMLDVVTGGKWGGFDVARNSFWGADG
jgi:hypothetical protein